MESAELCRDVKTEIFPTSDGGTSSSVGFVIPVDQQKLIKKEEHEDEGYPCGGTSSPVGCVMTNDQQTGGFQRKPIKEEEPEDDEFLYCEDCRSYFINKCEVHGPALFISDTPVPMGIADRAIQTLPLGLEVGKSDIPNAGLGVFNKGETIPLGAHFGPCEGDLVDREEAMNSGYSWVISRSRQCEKYIDGQREMHSNWMRYVNCARNEEEQNLVAFQYRGGILYRCCQPIKPGQELLMWYKDDYGKHLGLAFDYLWKKKCSSNEKNDALLQVFSCSQCPISYTSQIYLDNHIRRNHHEKHMVLLLRESKNDNVMHTESSSTQQTPIGMLHTSTIHGRMQNEEYHCSDCGKVFAYQSHLHQHQRIHTEMNHALLQVVFCSWCQLSYTSQIYLDNHIRRSHYEEHMRLLISRENKNDNVMPTGSFNIQQTLQTNTTHGRVQKEICHSSKCGKGFINLHNLSKHQCVHTREKPLPCSQCGKSFTYQCHLRQHQRIHTKEKPYHCSQCGKSFNQHGNLQRHQRIHTGEKPYHCSQCDRRFTDQGTLIKHQRIHRGDKPYHCSECGKRFSERSSFRNHQLIHTDEKPYQCLQCGKYFRQQRQLKEHQRIHTGEKPYLCSHCGNSFNKSSTLQRHQRIHTGEKPYVCSQCGKSFIQQSDLQRHQGIHTGEQQYYCSERGKSFNHQRIQTGEKPYHCSQCGKKFTRQSNLKEHELIHKGEKQFHCSHCRKSFNTKRSLRRHQHIHTGEKPYHCSECGKSFNQLHDLQKHHRIHTRQKTYQCSHCGKSFAYQSNLKTHQRVHTGEQPYHCSQCGQRFTYFKTFKKHKCSNVEHSACAT
ncbi:zinc finger protein 271 isoform X2 [Pangasianodon hypophthalmus]|uniref:zinc finger protein 271 isoform X2 n=1 Tax=Pangasianodon hypophthalmus TaxID=310915 RepID=UPI002307798F|nr:zinc finger protein 271 isoform X2 [Pangasianodon hypophthalmus]